MTLHNGTCTDKFPDKIFSTKGVCEKSMTLCETFGKEDDWKRCPERNYLSKKKLWRQSDKNV